MRFVEADRQEQRAEHGRHDQHHPQRGGGDQAGPREVAAQFGRIDAQEGERQHDDDGFAEVRLAGGGQRRHREADEDRGRHHAACPCGRARASAAAGRASKFIVGKLRPPGWLEEP